MGKHRIENKRRWRWLVVAAVALIVLSVPLVGPRLMARFVQPADDSMAMTPVASMTSGADECEQRQALRVQAASGIAEVLRSVGPPECVELELTVDDTAAPASALARGEIDVWVPDSRARIITPAAVQARSLALSPLVMAADASTAQALATQGGTSWAALLGRAHGQLELRMQPPATSSAALLVAQTLVPLAAAATGDTYLGYAAIAGTMKGVPALDPGAGQAGVVVAEARLLPDDLTVMPVLEGYPVLDYPWLPAPDLSPSVSSAAEQVLAALLSDDANQARADAGLLAPEATEVEAGGVTGPLLAGPELEQIPLLYALADAGGQRGYGTIVVDISGSMGITDDDAGPSRIDAVKASMQLALAVLADDTQMGLWVFGNDLEGSADHRALVPHGPMVQTRSAVAAAMEPYTSEFLKSQNYGTALYNVVRDAYAYAVDNWQPDHNNLVIVFTDGTNEDAPDSLDLAGLEAQLSDLADPQRPVQLVLFAYGEADVAALEAIAAVSGQGMVYPISSTEQIVGVMVDAIARSVLAQIQASS